MTLLYYYNLYSCFGFISLSRIVAIVTLLDDHTNSNQSKTTTKTFSTIEFNKRDSDNISRNLINITKSVSTFSTTIVLIFWYDAAIQRPIFLSFSTISTNQILYAIPFKSIPLRGFILSNLLTNDDFLVENQTNYYTQLTDQFSRAIVKQIKKKTFFFRCNQPDLFCSRFVARRINFRNGVFLNAH